MNKFGNCPLCGKQVKPTNLRKIARQNQLYGFRMALDGIAATWGALIQNIRCDADLTDEQVQKIIRIGDRYWEMVGKFKEEDMTPDEFADYITAKSEQVEKELRERWRRSISFVSSSRRWKSVESNAPSPCHDTRTSPCPCGR